MATRRRMQFIRGQLTWMVGAVLLLVTLGSVSYELVFVLSLLGLLIMTELTAPFNVTPVWRSRLKWLILAGLAGFSVIVIRRILEILPPGVFS